MTPLAHEKPGVSKTFESLGKVLIWPNSSARNEWSHWPDEQKIQNIKNELFFFIWQVEKLTQSVKQQEHNTENLHDAKRFQRGVEEKMKREKY